MKFFVDPKIFEKWPGVKVGAVVLLGINNSGHSEEVLRLLRDEELKKKAGLLGKDFGQVPEVVVWKEVYREFGSNPHEFRSSVEALLRRVRAGNPLPSINNLVDIYNLLSIKFKVPAGAEDLDKVKGDVSLAFAQGLEKGKYIGSESADVCYKGEVIYKDEVGFICRRWNWREADRTKIEEDTENALLVFEAMPPLDEASLTVVMQEAEELIKKYLGGETKSFILSKENSVFEVEFKTGTKFVEERLEITSGEKKMIEGKPKVSLPKEQIKKSLPTKDSLVYKIISELLEVMKSLYPDVALLVEDIELERPTVAEFGDYSTNVAMVLSKKVGKNPREIASEIVSKFKSDLIEKVEVAGAGFINFTISKDYLLDQLKEVLRLGEKFGMSNQFSEKKIVVEYTDPNPFKELHVGHLISNVIGESLARLHEASRAVVWRADYFGDVGVHAARSVWGIRKKMKEEKISLSDLSQKGLAEKVKFMGEGYALGTRLYDEDPTVKEEIDRLNAVLYIVAQKIWSEQGQEPIINYNPEGKISENEISEVYELYKFGRQWSLDYFESIYAILGTKFDGYYPESRVAEVGYKYVLDNIGKVFERSEGAVIFRGEKFGLHTRVFINKNNLPTYEAKELGLAPTKYKDFPYDGSIIVVGKEIKEYFQVLVEALKQINPQLGDATHPIFTGMVNVPQGKMSSRKGNVITVLQILNQLSKMAKNKMQAGVLGDEEKDKVAMKIAVGAVKYAFLKPSIGNDIVFDFEKSVSFEGDSGPYLQYTYSRCRSVIGKAKLKTGSLKLEDYKLNQEEMAVLRLLQRYPVVVEEAGKNYSPSTICSYLYDLAQKFNLFYNKHRIIDGEVPNEFRLALTEAVGIVIRNGLTLLGIETAERM